MVSSYLPELLGLADRVLVLRGGEIAGELRRGASEEDVLRLASGGGGPSPERDGTGGSSRRAPGPGTGPNDREEALRCLS